MIDRKCAQASVDYDVLLQLEGAHFAALASECERFGVSDISDFEQYKLCLLRQHRCRVENLLQFEVPRAAAMIDRLDWLVPREFPSAFCPPLAPSAP